MVSVSLLPAKWNANVLIGFAVQGQFDALIDPAGLITGLSNQEVALALLDTAVGPSGAKSKGVGQKLQKDAAVFLDSVSDKPSFVTRTATKAMSLVECSTPLHRRFVFFDQVHCTGVDVMQPTEASALVTVGKDMTFRDLAQAAWRMRKLGVRQQSATLLVPPEVVELIAVTIPQVKSDCEEDRLRAVLSWLVIQGARFLDLNGFKLAEQEKAAAARRAGAECLRGGAGVSIDRIRTAFVTQLDYTVPKSNEEGKSDASGIDSTIVQQRRQQQEQQQQVLQLERQTVVQPELAPQEPMDWDIVTRLQRPISTNHDVFKSLSSLTIAKATMRRGTDTLRALQHHPFKELG